MIIIFFLNIALKNEVFELTEGKNLYWKTIWKSEEFEWKCEGFIKKNEEIFMEKMKNLTEKGKEYIWQKYGNWRICMETCRIFIGEWRIYMEK